ncbi:MAG: TonB-dependent receptor [Microscillaceae bacterium]|jgi:hypothetical protein|nr:TonB-dependent receptor [Microscillaceae bacterium]
MTKTFTYKRFFYLITLLLLGSIGWQNLFAQVTTSAIKGVVADESGQVLPGVSIVATHLPSGTTYGIATGGDGSYTILNMRIGGPYTVEASYVGYQNLKVENVFLQLGEKKEIKFKLKSGVDLQEVIINADKDDLINSSRTGAGSVVSLEQLQTFPTITRSAADLTRLNPLAAEGGSFGGRNDQFNNYTLDGSIFNNPFGLDAATPGGQSNAQPVSLDAIEQISVSFAPYDVTKAGFTGASVDAVTKSGTNKFTGSVFGYFRNSDMTSGTVDGTSVNRGDLSQFQSGFSVGGPIIKNKLFFFANFELERRSDLGSYFEPNNGQSGENISRVLASDMTNISNLLRQTFNYETGAISGFKHRSDNQKGLFKLSYNLSQAHKLAITYNFLDAFREQPAHPSALGRRGPDVFTLQFQNSGYRINNTLHSIKAELNSQFGSKFANKFQAGYTSFRDSRDPFSAPFPVLNIWKDGSPYIIAGHEPFSINNRLTQDVFQLTNNFNIYLKKHTFTIGTSFERFAFDNSFNLTGYGARVFFPGVDINDVGTFIPSQGFRDEVVAARAAFENNNRNNSWALAETNIGQWAMYAQDEISVTPNLTLTIGLRTDMPLYFNTRDKMQENIDRQGGGYVRNITYYDADGNPTLLNSLRFPRQTPLFSPRIGFNFDINGDQTMQLRGGSGIFTGRFPFVWIGNQVANPNFFFYVVTDPNFKFPQVWRTNVGFDRKFANGWAFSADVIYTQDLQAMMVRNYGLRTPTGTLAGIDNRPIYLESDRAKNQFGGVTNAYVFTNTNVGYSFNTMLQVTKTFANNMKASLSYNFLDVRDAASIDAEISSDAYERNPANILNSNRPELAPALYGNKHRIVGSFYKKFSYGEKMATHVAIFMEYLQGGRFSYTYSGDINNDGSGLNDLIYIPTNAEIDQMPFTGNAEAITAQRNAFKSYIAQDKYLRKNQGEYAEKYAAINPWYSRWDMRIMQELRLGNGNSFQLSLDILNVGNLISSAWGVRQLATNTGLVQPLSVSVASGVPTYTFDTAQKSTFFNDFSLNSRWQMQLGLRYNF